MENWWYASESELVSCWKNSSNNSMKSQSVHGEETWKSLFPRLSINGNFPCFCTGSSEKNISTVLILEAQRPMGWTNCIIYIMSNRYIINLYMIYYIYILYVLYIYIICISSITCHNHIDCDNCQTHVLIICTKRLRVCLVPRCRLFGHVPQLKHVIQNLTSWRGVTHGIRWGCWTMLKALTG